MSYTYTISLYPDFGGIFTLDVNAPDMLTVRQYAMQLKKTRFPGMHYRQPMLVEKQRYLSQSAVSI